MHGDAGSAANVTQWQWNRPSALCPSAPGSRPAAVSTWNPLQIPITGLPAATNASSVAARRWRSSSAHIRPAPSASA